MNTQRSQFTEADVDLLRRSGVIHSVASGPRFVHAPNHTQEYCDITAFIGEVALRGSFDARHVGADSRIYHEFTGEELDEETPSHSELTNRALATSLTLQFSKLSRHAQLALHAALEAARRGPIA